MRTIKPSSIKIKNQQQTPTIPSEIQEIVRSNQQAFSKIYGVVYKRKLHRELLTGKKNSAIKKSNESNLMRSQINKIRERVQTSANQRPSAVPKKKDKQSRNRIRNISCSSLNDCEDINYLNDQDQRRRSSCKSLRTGEILQKRGQIYQAVYKSKLERNLRFHPLKNYDNSDTDQPEKVPISYESFYQWEESQSRYKNPISQTLILESVRPKSLGSKQMSVLPRSRGSDLRGTMQIEQASDQDESDSKQSNKLPPMKITPKPPKEFVNNRRIKIDPLINKGQFKDKTRRRQGNQKRESKKLSTNQSYGQYATSDENDLRQSKRILDQSNQTYTPRSSHSIVIYSKPLDEDKKITVFKAIDLQEQNIKIGGRKSKLSTQPSNTPIEIPNEGYQQNFMINYKPLNPRFNFKIVRKRTNFRVIHQFEGIYFGEVKDNKKHGEGVFITRKNIFEGKFQDNVKKKGWERNKDGIYRGLYLNGLRDGHGVFQWLNGQTYDGEWRQGAKEGKGIWTSPKGSLYDGEWKRNAQNGKGKFKHKMSVYEGQFVNFLKEGRGKEVFQNGDVFEGSYKNGKPQGFGKYTWADGGQFQGYFVEGMRNGFGKWRQADGNRYQGNFKNDMKYGEGTEYYKDGSYFNGLFRKGRKKEGTLLDANNIKIKI